MHYEVTITWADGTVEVARSRTYPKVREGALWIDVDRSEMRYIPLTSIREWSVVQR